jgi:hypothetical protein
MEQTIGPDKMELWKEFKKMYKAATELQSSD